VLTWTCDIDMTACRLVYGSILLAHAELLDDAMAGPAYPCALTIAQHEQIVHNGVGDCESAVCAVAGELIRAWVDVVNIGTKKDMILKDLLTFLGTFDLCKSVVVEDALFSMFVM
jgi:hypothetical protein